MSQNCFRKKSFLIDRFAGAGRGMFQAPAGVMIILISGPLTFIPFLFLFLSARFQVSVFRICYCVYLSWHLKPDTWNQIFGTKRC